MWGLRVTEHGEQAESDMEQHQVKVQQVYFQSQAFGASLLPQVSEAKLAQKAYK